MKRKNISLKRVLTAIGITISICGVVSALGLYALGQAVSGMGEWLSYEGSCLDWWGGADDPSAIEVGANIILPESTDNLFADSIAFQDCTVYVSFEMAVNDMDAFLASASYVSELQPVTEWELIQFTRFVGTNAEWSFDSSDLTYLYGEGSSDTGLEAQYILVEHGTHDTYIVYIVSLLL